MNVSTDLNTANHNYPTEVRRDDAWSGHVADTGPASARGDPPRLARLPPRHSGSAPPPGRDVVSQLGDHPVRRPRPRVRCRRHRRGGHRAGGGAAGLLAVLRAGVGPPRPSAQRDQAAVHVTSEDVLPENTLGTRRGRPRQEGWDEHFGYGRADLGRHGARSTGQDPAAGADRPARWFAPLLNVERQDRRGRAGRGRRARVDRYTYRLQWAPGIEPTEGDFETCASGRQQRRRRRARARSTSSRCATRSTTARAAAPRTIPPHRARAPATWTPTSRPSPCAWW